MTIGNDVGEKITLNVATIEYVRDYISEEMDTLFALATSIALQLTPRNIKDPQTGDNLVAFRLIELLEERVGSRKFIDSVTHILMGKI